jgi:hypothetical protein
MGMIRRIPPMEIKTELLVAIPSSHHDAFASLPPNPKKLFP